VDKNAPEIAKIDQRRCYQCRLCESKCPKNAIYYGRLVNQKDVLDEKIAEQVLVTSSGQD
jgi:ferredoxin